MHVIDRYARDVADGRIVAGKYHRLACVRHLRDRERAAAGDPSFPYRFEPDLADRFYRFAAQLRHYKGEWAGTLIKLEEHQRFRLGSVFAWVHVETGLRRYRVAYNEIPRKNGKSLEAAIVALYLTFFDGEAGAEGYCLDESTRVLCADLRWRAIRDLSIGDGLIAFDEYPPAEIRGAFRKLRPATVLALDRIVRPCYRLTFATGRTVIASAEHRWLGPQYAPDRGWIETQRLTIGDRVRDFGEPWRDDDSRDAGYLAGIFDGEGYIFGRGERSGFRIGFAQNPGVVLDHTLDLLHRSGFATSPLSEHGSTQRFSIAGMYQCFRLLGQMRPTRLLDKLPHWYPGRAPSRFGPGYATVVRIEPLGDREVVAIATSTRTLFAEGLYSHNCIATKREQARIVWNDCKRLVLANRALKARIVAFTANLHRNATASKLEPLGADRDSTDGLNPHLVTIDEAHALKNRGMIDVMETAIGARRQPLINWITTAGNDPVSPCGDQHDYACRVLDATHVDETLFAFIAHADADDDPWAVETWRKANPNFGVSVKQDDLENLARKARHMPAASNAFRQKRLNVWVNTLAPWLSMEGWQAGQSDWTLDEMLDEPCWLGIDLSSKIDLTAIALVFPPTDERRAWRIGAYVLTPEATLDERAHRDRAPYREWVDAGFLRTCPGNRIDQDAVRDLVLDACDRFDVRSVGVDPYNAGNLVQLLETGDGLSVIEIAQSMLQMSGPAKDFEADVLDGLIDAGRNPLLAWCASNVVVMNDNKGNIYPVKKRSRGRIDPIVAALFARKLAALDVDTPPAEPPVLVVA